MAVFDTPITTDDNSLKKVLGQKQPAILILYDTSKRNAPLEETMQREAKKHAGALLVVRVNAASNPQTVAQYGENLALPALITLTPAFFGRNVKSKAENVRPADVRAHIDHLLNDAPLPEPPKTAKTPNSKGATAVTDRTFNKEVLNSNVPVLVDFWAEWCAPCRSIAPYVEQVAKEYSGRVKVVKLNVDQNPATAQQYNVRSIPTFAVFHDGKLVGRQSGASQAVIQSLIRQVLD